MDKFHVSKFNYHIRYENRVLIFNSLCNTFTTMNRDDYNTMYANNNDELSGEILKILDNQGIICSDGYDEDKKALIKYMEIVDSGYVELIILPTLMCNFRCPYCYEERVPGVMSDEIIERIVKFTKGIISSAKGIHVSWFGGEPMVAMPVIEKLSERLMKLSKAYKKSYTASMTTNGYLLTYENFMKLFRKYHVSNYQITLDGRAEFHNKTRPLAGGGATYEVIMKNLLDIKEKCLSPVYHILIRSNLTKDTSNDLENHVIELEKGFGGDNRFSFMFKAVGDWGGETVGAIKDSLINVEDTFIKRITNLKTNLLITGRYQFFENFNVCYAAKQGTYTIDPSGKVLRCTVNLYEPYNILGELDERGIIKRNNPYYEKWQYPASPPAKPGTKCENCGLYANCYGILCPIKSVVNNGNVPCDKKDAELMNLYVASPELFVNT